MKTMILTLLTVFPLTTFAVCHLSESHDFFGSKSTLELSAEISAYAAATRPANLTAEEIEIWQSLADFLQDDRGIMAARKIMNHFDENNNGRLTYTELKAGFMGEPFYFSEANSTTGATALVAMYGPLRGINEEGVLKFVTRYGF